MGRADEIVNGSRNIQYGDPNADFKRTAAYWNIHLQGILDRKLTLHTANISEETKTLIKKVLQDILRPEDVAIFQGLLKTSRLAWSPDKADSWCDWAGYAACGFDVSEARIEDLP